MSQIRIDEQTARVRKLTAADVADFTAELLALGDKLEVKKGRDVHSLTVIERRWGTDGGLTVSVTAFPGMYTR